MMIINSHSQNDQMIRKETDWFNEQNFNINQEQPLSSETPYYKYQNNIGK